MEVKKAVRIRYKTRILVIGAGQAGLSAAYHLRRLGWEPGPGFLVVDEAEGPGGAWQHRWRSLTLSTVNRIHDLPGMAFSEVVGTERSQVEARVAVPAYFDAYEKRFDLRVLRPVKINRVYRHGARFHADGDRMRYSAEGIINATGTWSNPNMPEYPGASLFLGEQLHTKDFVEAEYFRGKHVIVVGAGISAIQLLDQISRVTTTTWVTRRVPHFREGPFDDAAGSEAVALVDARVRQGLLPQSVVSVTGLPITPAIQDMQRRGVLRRLPMFSAITPTGVRWEDGTEQRADVILWNTGFKGALDHLAEVISHEPGGGIRMDGALATRVAAEPRIHLPGYGPSASTIGANRAGGTAVRELIRTLERDGTSPSAG